MGLRLRRTATAGTVSVLLAAAVAACGGQGEGSSYTETVPPPPDYDAELEGAPRPLARLHDRAGELLEGGVPAFRRELEALRGYPVVVNKWASWCGPCRQELPFFQAQSARRGTEVAFLGVNSNDGRETARGFIDEYPVPYPHIVDDDQRVAVEMQAGMGFPATTFYGADGELLFTRYGEYASEIDLANDILEAMGE